MVRDITVRWDPSLYCYVATWSEYAGFGDSRERAVFDLGFWACLLTGGVV